MADESQRRVDELLLKIAVEESSTRKAENRIESFRTFINRTAKEAKSLDVAGRLLSSGVADLGRHTEQTEKRLAKLRDRMQESTDRAIDLAAAEKQLAREMENIDRLGAGGSTGGATPGRRTLLTTIASDVSQIVPAGPVQQVAGVLNGFTASIDQMGAKAALAGGGIGLLTVGISLLQQQSERAAEAARNQIQAGLNTITLAKSNTTEELKIKQEAALVAIGIEKAKADAANAALAELRTFVEGLSAFEKITLGASIISGIGDSGKQLQAIRAEVDAQNAALAQAEADYRAATNALNSHDVALNDLAAARERLTQREAEAAKTLAALQEQRDKLLAQEGAAVREAAEQRTINALRAQQDADIKREADLKAHVDRIAAIDAAGNDRLAALRAQGVNKLVEAEKAIGKLGDSLADLDKKLGQDRQKINADFMRSEIADLEKFHEQERKSNNRAQKERLRRIEDQLDDERDAEMNNDVVRFVAIQRAAEKDLRRMAEDADEATQERQREFEIERKLNSQRHAERLADIESAAAARRADIQAQIAERQLAKDALLKDIGDQLAAEKQRIFETKQAVQAAFDEQLKKEEAARALRRKRQDEDEARADLKRQNALNIALNDIDRKSGLEHAAVNSLIALVGRLQARIASTQITSGVAPSSSGSAGYSSGWNTGSGSNRPAFAFGAGRIPMSPTIGLLSERPGWLDAVMPFRKSEGFENAAKRMGIGGETVIIHLNAPIGDGVTRAEVTAELQKLGQSVINATAKARAA